jgi:tetrahydrodipicolinate N-succinyltransferase
MLHHAVIPMSVEIGEGSELAYGGLGTVLHERCKIGKFVTIGHQVSIGGRSRRWGVPIIEDRCVIGAGAILLGPISIGTESVVGANAVVLEDVPSSERTSTSWITRACNLLRKLKPCPFDRPIISSSRSFKIPVASVIWPTNGLNYSVTVMPIACF